MSDDTLRLNIDSTGAARGAANFEQAVRRVEAAVLRLEASSSGTASRISTSFNSINFAGLSSQIAAMSAQLSRANASLTGFNAGLNNTSGGFRSFNSGVSSSSKSLFGLQNQLNITYQLTTLLRGALAGLTLQQFTQGIFDAANATAGFNNALRGVLLQLDQVKNASNPAAEAARMLGEQYQFVEDVSTRLGTSLAVNIKEYPKLASAMLLSGRSAEEVARVFEVFSGSMSVMNLDADRSRLVMLALTQMFSKGKISAEELRRQLGEQIPGAFELMQSAIRDATGNELFNLDDALRQGKVTSEAVLLLTERMAEVYGSQFPAALNTSGAQARLFFGEIFKFQKLMADSGANQGFIDALKAINKELQTAAFKKFAADLGKAVGDIAVKVGGFFVFLIRNAQTLLDILTGYIALKAVGITFGIISSAAAGLDKTIKLLTASFIALRTASLFMLAFAGPVALLGAAVVGAFGAAVASTDAYKNSTLSMGDIAAYTFDRIGKFAKNFWDEISGGAAASSAFTKILKYMLNAVSSFVNNSLGFLNGLYDGVEALFEGEAFSDAFAKGFERGSTMMSRAAEDFVRGAAEFKKQQETLGLLRGRQEESTAATSSPTDVSKLKLLTEGEGKGGADKAAKQAEKRRKEFEKFLQVLNPAIELESKRRDLLADVAKFEKELSAVGISRTEAMRLANESLKEQNGLLTETEQALSKRETLEKKLASAVQLGIIPEERRKQLLNENNVELLDSVGGYSAAEMAARKYAQSLELLNALLEKNKITSEERAAASDRVTESFNKELLGVDTLAGAQLGLKDRLDAISRSNVDLATKTLLSKQAFQAFAMGLSETASTYDAQIEALTRLRDAGSISQETFVSALDAAKIKHLELMTQLGDGSYIDVFEANILRMTESVNNLNLTFGNMLTKTTEQLAGGFSDALAGAIVKGEDFGSVMKGVVDSALQSLLSSLINLGIQYLLNSVMASTAQAAVTAATTASMATIAAAAAPAAAAVATATFGAAAAAGSAGLSAIHALSKALSAAPMKDGGFVSGTGGGRTDSINARLSNGEYVINAAATARNMGLLETINAGGNAASVAAAAGAGGGGGMQNIKIVNQIDPNESLAALDTPSGERLIINLIERRKDQINRIISR